MPDKHQKVIENLYRYGELSMLRLQEKTGIRRNDLFKLIPEMLKNGKVRTRKKGRENLVSLNSPEAPTKSLLINFDKRLRQYEKIIETELKALEKSKPLISFSSSFEKVKTKEPIMELDKKRNVYRPMGKIRDGYAYDFKTRPTPRKHFDNLLDLLHKLYQESSVLNFADTIVDDETLLRDWQKKSEKLIIDTVNQIEKMFYEQRGYVFVVSKIRMVLYGLIYKATLEEEIGKA